MGSTESPETSLRITMGLLVTGSSTSPRIVTSTSIAPCAFPAARLTPLYHQFADQRIGEAGGNGDRNVGPGLQIGACSRGEIQALVLGRAADPLRARLVVTFNHHLKGAPDISVVNRPLNLALPLHQDFEAAGFLLIRNGVVEFDGGRIRTRRILEGKDAVIADLIEQVQRLFELPLGFSWKTNNYVRRQRDISPRSLDPSDAFQVLLARIETLHGIEHARGAALHRQVDVIAQRGHGINGLDDVTPEIARM